MFLYHVHWVSERKPWVSERKPEKSVPLVIVSTDSFGIVVDHDGFFSRGSHGTDATDGGIIELDTVTNAVGSSTQHNVSSRPGFDVVLSTVIREVEVVGVGFEFSG